MAIVICNYQPSLAEMLGKEVGDLIEISDISMERVIRKILEINRSISHMIAVEMLGWGYSAKSETYWLEFGHCLGMANSFNPIDNRHQGNLVIEKLELPCSFENLKDYVLSLSDNEKKTIRAKYGPIQREEAGIKYYVVENSNVISKVI